MIRPPVTPHTALRLALIPMVIALATLTVADHDIWGHLRFGSDMLTTGILRSRDVYSFASDEQWINHEWAAQIAFAWVYRAGGIAGLVVLKTLMVCLTLGTVAWSVRHLPPLQADVLLISCALVVAPLTIQIRPQIFSLVALVALLAVIRGPRPWLAVPLFAAWANLHGGWLLGLLVMACWAMAVPRGTRIAIFFGSVIATLVNPFGIALWTSLFDAMRRGWGNVREWDPSWTNPVALIGWMAVTALLVSRTRRADRFTLLAGTTVAVLALRSLRLLPLYGAAAVMLAAGTWQSQREAPPHGWDRRSVVIVAAFWTIVLVLCVPATYRHLTCIPVGDNVPDAGAEQALGSLHGRVVTWFDYGLFATWYAPPDLEISMDGRRETVYSDAVVNEQFDVAAGRRDPIAYCDSVRADLVWYPRAAPAVKVLRQAGWVTIFSGSQSVILSRRPIPLLTANAVAESPRCFPDYSGDDWLLRGAIRAAGGIHDSR